MKRPAISAAVILVVLGSLGGQRPTTGFIPANERRPVVAMACCRSTRCIKAQYSRIRKPGTVARIVYYSKLIALSPSDAAAALGLLKNFPRSEDENGELIGLQMSMYDDETTRQMNAVAQIYWKFNQRLAQALRSHPQFLARFIKYGEIGFLDAQSDYPDWAARVCRRNPSAFLKAFSTLPSKDRSYIAEHIIQPRGCKQIAIPEAE